MENLDIKASSRWAVRRLSLQFSQNQNILGKNRDFPGKNFNLQKRAMSMGRNRLQLALLTTKHHCNTAVSMHTVFPSCGRSAPCHRAAGGSLSGIGFWCRFLSLSMTSSYQANGSKHPDADLEENLLQEEVACWRQREGCVRARTRHTSQQMSWALGIGDAEPSQGCHHDLDLGPTGQLRAGREQRQSTAALPSCEFGAASLRACSTRCPQ